MNLAETIVLSLRRAGALILKNMWLLGWSALYTLALPVLMLGGTGIPILFWVITGGHFQPKQLFSDPGMFLLEHLPLVLLSMAGCFVAFTIFLVILLFYTGAVTGVAVRGFQPGGDKADKVPSGSFWEEGRQLMGASLSTATLASLLPLLPFILLAVMLILAVLRLPQIFSANFDFSISGAILIIVGIIITGVATGITTFLGLIWYRLALALARVEHLPGATAFSRAWNWARSHAGLVAGYVLAMIILNMLSWGVTAPFSFGGKLLGHSSKLLGLALEIMAAPLGIVLSLFMDLWLKCALVALVIDNNGGPAAQREPAMANEPIPPPLVDRGPFGE